MLGSILVFILVLSLLVLVHEFGHYIVARLGGVWVEEFGFGLPPRLWGKKIGETLYSINLLPFGGFVRLHGESGEDKLQKPKRAFLGKSKKVRVAIVTAGVVMKFVLALVAFTIVYSTQGIPRETKNVRVLDVTAGAPAQAAGLIPEDIFKSANGQEIISVDQFISVVEENKGTRVKFEIERVEGRQTNTITMYLTPRVNPPENEGPLGVVISQTEVFFPPLGERVVYGVYYGARESVFWGKAVVIGLVNIIGQLLSGQAPTDLTGPVGVYIVTSEAAKVGFVALVNFVGILSVNLAIFNIIPFPALDGGRLLFIALEGLLGRKVLPRVEAVVHAVGLVILLLLIAAITARDISRLITAGGVSGFIDSVLK